METELIWTAREEPGYEHVRIDDSHPGWTVFDSMFVRVHEGSVRRGGYTLICDKDWRTLELRIMVEQTPGAMTALHLLASGDGRWTDAEETSLPELDGCIDVDIAWTPLTNTLPIRRLGLQPDQQEEIRVVSIDMPSLAVGTWRQRYTGLLPGRVRYESIDRDGFVRELDIDARGFVVDYPGLFHRAWPGAADTKP